MADYTTTTDVKAQVPEGGWTGTTDYDAQIASLITAASRMIDLYLGVGVDYFQPSTDEQTRYYDGNDELSVKIDEAVSISSVAVSEDGTTDYETWAASDYYFRPLNYSALGLPISRIVIDTNGDQVGFPCFPRAVRVTGIFGYSATPPAIVTQACNVQVIHWLMRSKSAWQNQGANETMLTDTGGKLDEDVKTMLLPLLIGRL